MKLPAEDHPTAFWDFNDPISKVAIIESVERIAKSEVRSFLIRSHGISMIGHWLWSIDATTLGYTGQRGS